MVTAMTNKGTTPMTSIHSDESTIARDEVRVPMCGVSADIQQPWNKTAAPLREKLGVEEQAFQPDSSLDGETEENPLLFKTKDDAPVPTPDAVNRLAFYLPPELEPMRHEIRRFIEAMLYKLRKNAHKGKWENLDITKAFRLMRREIDELEAAVAEGNSVETLLEAADTANFAMMIGSIATEKGA